MTEEMERLRQGLLNSLRHGLQCSRRFSDVDCSCDSIRLVDSFEAVIRAETLAQFATEEAVGEFLAGNPIVYIDWKERAEAAEARAARYREVVDFVLKVGPYMTSSPGVPALLERARAALAADAQGDAK